MRGWKKEEKKETKKRRERFKTTHKSDAKQQEKDSFFTKSVLSAAAGNKESKSFDPTDINLLSPSLLSSLSLLLSRSLST